MKNYKRGDVVKVPGDYERFFMVINTTEKYFSVVQIYDKALDDGFISVLQKNGDGWYADPGRVTFFYKDKVDPDSYYEPIEDEDVCDIMHGIAIRLGFQKSDSGPFNEPVSDQTVNDATEKKDEEIKALMAEIESLKERVALSISPEKYGEEVTKRIKAEAKLEVFEGLYREEISKQ